MSLGPVVASTTLSEDKVVWPEDLTEWSRPDRVHCTWLKIDQNCSWNVFASCGFIVVDVDSLKLEITVTVVCAGGVNAVLV